MSRWTRKGGTNTVNVAETLESLIEQEDTDGDKAITVDDPHISDERGVRAFRVPTDRGSCVVTGTYYLSNLLQELKLLEEAGVQIGMLQFERIFEPPVTRISRRIREDFWDGLTRRIDEEGLPSILEDEKTATPGGDAIRTSPRPTRGLCRITRPSLALTPNTDARRWSCRAASPRHTFMRSAGTMVF